MSRAIFTLDHLSSFLASSAYSELVNFVRSVVESAKGTSQKDSASTDFSDAVTELLQHAIDLTESVPPEAQATRFGNRAFRTWHEKLAASSGQHIDALLKRTGCATDDLAATLSAYWGDCFGNSVRIDYGTGHEACFFIFLFVLSKHVTLTPEDIREIALSVFPKYLDAVDAIHKTYNLEPAGSHGVWSLDDYHFLVFVIGASQLTDAKSCSYLTPRAIRSRSMVHDHASQFMYMRGVKKLIDSKRGPFEEHSPMLHDLSGLRSWEDVCSGLFRMWEGEVLGKFPVAQHFLFCDEFPSTWTCAADASQSPAVRGPAALRGFVPSGVDALSKYFKRSDAVAAKHELLTNGIRISGWKISSVNERISSDAELESIMGGPVDMPVPEMIFGTNKVEFLHEASGKRFMFDTISALKGTQIKFDKTDQADRYLFKVPYANLWDGKKVGDDSATSLKHCHEDYDWTFTTLKSGAVIDGSGKTIEPQLTDAKIDYEHLKKREGILWFDEVDLFEDDLHDNGVSKLYVKVRVMPSCFFAVHRFWLRADKHFARVYDTRVFHMFKDNKVLIEVRRRECTYEAMIAKGFAASDKALASPDMAAPHLDLIEERTLAFEV